ncbi:hypothetical protein [Alkalihalobacillus sp. AL-G]|uniref:hypothetical protein n=1 Tax=Alkalihalobacillus sp. AL-G TaxID=2926399 RepID=UPI00272D4F55|nr:hypothetical protein [Alkalihalobacillus sp. AL-G]WLD94312.1 hypothetical protein MOJ78_05310 [Alkalihalobacillus sp. AL-G]
MPKIKRLIFMVMLLLLTACVGEETIRNQTFEKAINSELKKAGTTEIRLKEHTDFPWDKAFVFTPYTSNEQIQEQLADNDIDSKLESSIEYLDGFNLIVFTNDGEVVQYAEVSRKYGDLKVKENNGFTPEHDEVPVQLHNS